MRNIISQSIFRFVFSFLYFALVGTVSLIILKSKISLASIIQIFLGLIALIAISIKFIYKVNYKNSRLLFIFGLLPFFLFVDLLVFATGNVESPFLVLTHLVEIGLAFLVTPTVAVSFAIATVALLLTSGRMSTINPLTSFASFVYLVAYFALIPFAYLLSRQYRVKEEWAGMLEKQISTSKSQEEELLKNIDDAVFAVNQKFEVAYLNKAARELSKLTNSAIGHYLFDFISFKDKDGRILDPYALPFEQTLVSKQQSLVENIQIAPKGKSFRRADLKILPAFSSDEVLGVLLVVHEQEAKEAEVQKRSDATTLSLSKFLYFLNKQKQAILSVAQNKQTTETSQTLLRQNEELKNLAEDFIFALKLDLGDVGAISEILDLGKLLNDLVEKEQPVAEKSGLKLVAKEPPPAEEVIAPKGRLEIKVEKSLFPEVYVLGNPNWIWESLRRIYEIAFNLSIGKTIETELVRQNNLAIIKVSLDSDKIPSGLENNLFDKFYGKLSALKVLGETSGLDGFIAKSLISRMGGSVSAQAAAISPTLVFTITLGETQNKVNPASA